MNAVITRADDTPAQAPAQFGSGLNLLQPELLGRADALRLAFQNNRPFRHVVIDDFLDPNYAQALLDAFPPFERGSTRTEDGSLGNKSSLERIRELGPAYVQLDDLIQTPAFLDLIGHLTGIPDLLYDPWYFGGGTHENRHGQDLDVHVDFNRHPIERWHRRLNLIVYLNPHWQHEWGGSLELHSDPRSDHDEVICIAPRFNRAVLFETTEWSWHGFPLIQIPEADRAISPKSVALYFYSKERPVEELASIHSTVYVDRPLPTHLTAGHTLEQTDINEIRYLVKRRDMHNQRLYTEIASLMTQLDAANAMLASRTTSGRLYRLARRVWHAIQRLRQ